MDKNTLVSVATVLQNSGAIVESYLQEVTGVLEGAFEHFEIVLIDNGSTDHTIPVVKECMKRYRNVRLVVLSRRYDDQVAYTAVLESSIGDYVIIMDANTDPPALIPKMLETAMGGGDIVTAEVAGRRNQPFLHRFLSRVFYRLSNLLTEVKIDLNWSNYVCFSRKIVNSILQIKDRVRYLKYLTTDIGYSHRTVRYQQINRSRESGRTRLWNRAFFALDTLVANSERLLRLTTALSLLMSIMSGGYIFYAVVVNLMKRHVTEGWTSTSMVLAALFSALFFILFILGEYLSLIYKETKKGPLYHVADEMTSSALFETIRERNVI